MIRYDGTSFTLFTTEDGLMHDDVRSVVQDSNGVFWIGTLEGVSRYDGKTFTSFSKADGLLSSEIFASLLDREGYLWFSTYQEGVCRYAGQTWTSFTTGDGLAHNAVSSMLQDRNGRMWFGTLSGGVSCYDGQTWTTWTHQDGLGSNFIHTLFEDQNGHMWFGSSEGATRYDGQIFQTLTAEDGLVDDYVISIAQDDDNQIWFATYEGITKYRQPSPSPPGVVVDAVVADKRYDNLESLSIPTSAGLIAFEFHGISFKTRREAMVFRYRLKDFDRDWQNTRETRVEYPPLPIGTYTFEVVAVDRDLVYSEEPATVHLNVIRDPRDSRIDTLDRELRHLRDLHRLRSALEPARSIEDSVTATGETLMADLPGIQGILMVCDEREWHFGRCEEQDLLRYERTLVWNGKIRGRLVLLTERAWSDAWEQAFLDEIAGQVSRALEARELEMQLLRSSRLVSMGQMAAGMAHELSQPLGAVSTTVGDVYLRLLDEIDLPPDELKEMMRDSAALIERMEHTINHLRMFSRDTSQVSGVVFSLNEAVHSSLKIVGTQLKNHGIEVVLDLADDLPEVEGFPHQMDQVFLNLLANARDALDERTGGWKRIEIRTRPKDGRVIGEVTDNGPGMDVAVADQVFEPFFTTKTAEHGTGLGLSISYAIVRNHGGEMICESRKGKGTMFQVSLPVIRNDS